MATADSIVGLEETNEMKFLEKYKMDLIVDSRDAYKKVVLSLLDTNVHALLLDLGCGSGHLTQAAIAKVMPVRAYLVDTNEETTPEAEKLGFEVQPLDLNGKLGLKSSWFDVVIASQVIEHLWNTDLFVKEIYRVLKPEGYAVISTPNLASWHNVLNLALGKQPETSAVSDEMRPEMEKPGHRRVFTATELVKLLEFHGLEVEWVIGTSYYPLMGRLAKLMCNLDRRHAGMTTVKVRK